MRANTIGEVLNRLRDEFNDITIAKIRHLEAEGLISPDRTESGYRKFTENDVARLQHVLRAQRERGLTLQAIRAELDHGGQPAAEQHQLEDEDDTDDESVLELTRTPPTPSAPTTGPASYDTDGIDLDVPELQLSMSELADTSGLTVAQVAALRDHGVLGSTDRFDGDDLQVARVAALMIQAGLEPRHLRMFRQFAQREAALIDQRIGPLLRQRNPDSRQEAIGLSEELMALGEQLQHLILAAELRRTLRSWR